MEGSSREIMIRQEDLILKLHGYRGKVPEFIHKLDDLEHHRYCPTCKSLFQTENGKEHFKGRVDRELVEILDEYHNIIEISCEICSEE